MGLNKRQYTDGQTIITAANLNEIQDCIIAIEGSYVPKTRTVNSKALTSNITLSASDVGAVPTSRTVNSKALSGNITLSAADVGAVPVARTVNSKALSSNITLNAADVGAVPTSRKVNSKALSADITLVATDIGYGSSNVGATLGSLNTVINDEIAEIKTYVRPNLLDNWYFIGGGSQQGKDYFPINQRGGTSKSSSGYWIDRWYMNAQSGATFSIESNGFKILKTAGANSPGINQTFEANLDGKQITVSILDSNNNLLTATATVNSSTSGWQINKSNNLWWMGFRFNNSRWDLSITSASIILVAAKIEIGGDQTLCHNTGTENSPVWVLNEVPNYATELYKCRRYLQKAAGNWDMLRLAKYTADSLIFELPLPVQLKSAPNLSSYLNNQMRVYPVGGWTQVTGFTAIDTGVTHSGLRLTLTKSSHGLTDASLQINNGVFYSAEP